LKDASVFLLGQLLKEYKYSISKQQLALRLLSDPDNLVLSFTNTLDYFNVEHIAANVPKTALEQLPQYFIAQVSNGKTEYIALASKETNNTIKIQLSEEKIVTLSENQFLNDWTGFIIAIEENKAVGKASLSKDSITKVFLLLFSLSFFGYVFLVTNSILLTTYFALSLIGLGLGYLIIKEKIGQQTFASKYCKITTITNCVNVLNSKSAKVFKSIDLSDIVVMYFIVISVYSLLQPFSILTLIISAIALPVVVYSIYEQYFTIKKWCPLCLGVAFVLVLQFSTLLATYETTLFQYSDILLLTTVLAITIIGWLALKPLLLLEQKNITLEIENLSFRRNHKLFIPYYNALTKLDTEDSTITQIVLGAENPIIKLTIITNPLCKSCIEAHKTYIDLLQKYKDSIQLNFRFLVPNKDRADNKTIISERLLQLYFENDTEVFFNAFNDWYSNGNTKMWTKKWGKCKDIKYNKMLSQQIYWCLKQGIESTPIILINKKLFPKNYSFKDIEHFVEPILEQEMLKTKKEINNIHA